MTPKSTEVLRSERSILQAAMEVAEVWALRRSKDPSTKVGAVIYDPASGGLFAGYNGFPAGIEDRKEWWERREDLWGNPVVPQEERKPQLTKYDLVVHAEVNAVRKALRAGVDLGKATLVVTHLPCPECMKNVVVANGIPKVVWKSYSYKSQTDRAVWLAGELAELSGTELVKLEG